ncbi:hypothetical protein BJ912DRAFT_69907 [Pholiota molesta]|nr:hypothetical protein BJ912DRAFT_69907 [Pholiota molesta]
MSTIAMRFKSVFVPSTRRNSQPTSSIHSSFPTSEPITPILTHPPSEAQPGQTFPSTTPRASTGSSTIYFSVEQPDSTHDHRPRANTTGRATQRTRITYYGSSAPGSPPGRPPREVRINQIQARCRTSRCPLSRVTASDPFCASSFSFAASTVSEGFMIALFSSFFLYIAFVHPNTSEYLQPCTFTTSSKNTTATNFDVD